MEVYELNNKKLTMLKWIGTIFTISGATASSFDLFPLNIIYYNCGTVFWLIASIKMKDLSLIVVNSGLLVIYLIGIIKSQII
jgi:hypothetical protein